MQYKHTVTLKPSALYPKLIFVLFCCMALLLAFAFVPIILKTLLFLVMAVLFCLAARGEGLHGRITQLIWCVSENRVACIESGLSDAWYLDEPSFPVITPYLLMLRGRRDGRWHTLWFMRDSLPWALPYQYNRLRACHFRK